MDTKELIYLLTTMLKLELCNQVNVEGNTINIMLPTTKELKITIAKENK